MGSAGKGTFTSGLIDFITSGPVVAMAWTGVEAIKVARNLIGPTNGREAVPGTIRGDFAMDIGHNIYRRLMARICP